MTDPKCNWCKATATHIRVRTGFPTVRACARHRDFVDARVAAPEKPASTRETLTVTVLGDKVTLEVSAAARAHLEERVSLLDTPGACVSHLVQALAVCAAYPDSPREAAHAARMSYSRWLAVVCLAATGYSALGEHLDRARKALVRS